MCYLKEPASPSQHLRNDGYCPKKPAVVRGGVGHGLDDLCYDETLDYDAGCEYWGLDSSAWVAAVVKRVDTANRAYMGGHLGEYRVLADSLMEVAEHMADMQVVMALSSMAGE